VNTKKMSAIIVILALMVFIFSEYSFAEENVEYIPEMGRVRIIRAPEIGQEKWTFEDYFINSGDVLDISVWQVEDLQGSFIVRPDGKLSFPLIGDVDAGGKTIADLAATMTQKLKTYIKSPQVSVMVKSFGGKKVIVLGEVTNRGIIRFTEPIRIMEVLALSGGYLESAGLGNVLVIRGDLRNHTNVIRVDVLSSFKSEIISVNVICSL